MSNAAKLFSKIKQQLQSRQNSTLYESLYNHLMKTLHNVCIYSIINIYLFYKIHFRYLTYRFEFKLYWRTVI